MFSLMTLRRIARIAVPRSAGFISNACSIAQHSPFTS